MVGAEAQPRREVSLIAPGADIGTDFEENLLRSLQADSVNAR
jgi:hypothetical protein